MTQTVIQLTATHWWSVLGWTIWAFFWIGLAEFLLGLPLYALLRRRSPELRYNALLAWMLLLAITPLYLLVHISHTLPVPLTIALTSPPLTTTIPQPEPIRHESPDSIPNILPPEKPLDSMPTLIVPDQTLSRIPNIHQKPTPQPQSATPQSLSPITIVPRPSLSVLLPLPTQSENPWLTRLIPWLPGLWFLGATLSSLLISLGLVGAERFRRQARLLTSGPLFDRCGQLAAQLHIRGKVLIGLTDRIATPILLGIWRPLILLPITAETGWPPDQLDMILLHELAHVRRFDNLVHLLQRLAEGLLFFQPAVWILSHWISQEREHCCDSLVVRTTGRPHDYARTLAHIALGEPFPTNLAPASALAQSHVLTRIRRILNQEQTLQVSRGTLAIASSCLLAALLIVGALNARETPPQIAQKESSSTPKEAVEPLTEKPAPKEQKPGFKSITARVVDGAKNPVPNATVILTSHPAVYTEREQMGADEPDRRELPPLTTDSKGLFTFEADLLCTYTIKIKPPAGFLAPENNGSLIPTRPDDLGIQDFVVKRPAKIRARVTGLDGQPLPGAPFSLTANSSFGNAFFSVANILQAVSGDDGRFEIDRIPPGTVILYYPWSGGLRAVMKESDINRFPLLLKNPQDVPVKDHFWFQAINLTDGEMKSIEINLADCNASLRGKLVDADNRPIPNRFIRLSSLVTVPSQGTTSIIAQGYHGGKTDAEGRYEITGLFPADYDIQAVDENGQPVSPQLPVRLTPNTATTRWLRPLPPQKTEIAKLSNDIPIFDAVPAHNRILIVDEHLAPIPYPHITLEKWQPARTPGEPRQLLSATSQSTDASGILKFTSDFAFEGELRVQKEGYVTESHIPFRLNRDGFRTPDNLTNDWKIQLKKYARVFVNLTDANRKPVANFPLSAVYSWRAADGLVRHATAHAVSDPTGRVTFDRVPDGTVQLFLPWLGEEGYLESEFNQVTRDQWKSLLLSGDSHWQPAHWSKSFNIKPGQAQEFYLNLADCKHSIAGVLKDSTGKLLTNVPVSLQSVFTDGEGGHIGFVPTRVTIFGFKDLVKDDTSRGPNVNRIKTSELPPLTGYRTELLRTLTDDKGNWNFTNLAPGSYHTLVHLDDSVVINTVTVPEPAVTDKANIQITLPPDSRLSTDTSPIVKKLHLTVRDPFGNPLPDALLVVQQPGEKNSPLRFYALTDSQGNADISDVKPGPVSVLYPLSSLLPPPGSPQREDFQKRVEEFLRKKFPTQFKSLEYHVPVKDRVWFSNFNIESERITNHEIKLADCNASLDLAFMDERRLPLASTPFTITPVLGKETQGSTSPLRENRVRITLLSDQIGHLRIGKIPSGRYLVTWFNDTPARAGSTIVGVSPNQNHARILYIDSKTGGVTWDYMDPNKTTPGDPLPDSLSNSKHRIDNPKVKQLEEFPESPHEKKLHLTLLGPDRKKLPGALVGLTFKPIEGASTLTRYAVSDAQGEITLNLPEEGVVNLVYPIWLGTSAPVPVSRRDEFQTRQFEQDLRRVIGPAFKNLADHVPVKNLIYANTFKISNEPQTNVTADFSTCNSQLNLRFVDESRKPVIPRFLELAPDLTNFKELGSQFDHSDFFYPLSLNVDSNGRLPLPKINHGNYKLSWDGDDKFGRQAITLNLPVNTTRDLLVKWRQTPQVDLLVDDPAPENPPLTAERREPPPVVVPTDFSSDRVKPDSPKSAEKKLHLTLLGLDKKPLAGALMAVVYKSTERPLDSMDYDVSDSKGEISFSFPEEGIVNLVYPVWLGPGGSQIDPSNPPAAKFEQDLRRVIGSKFQSLAVHFPLKGILYARLFELSKTQETRFTVDFSECRSPVTFRFVDEAGQPVKPQSPQLSPPLMELRQPAAHRINTSEMYYPLSLGIGDDGVLNLGKMNPGAFLLHCDIGQESHGIPLQVKQDTPQNLIVNVRQQSQIKVTPDVSAGTSSSLISLLMEKKLHLTLLGPDKKPLPKSLIMVKQEVMLQGRKYPRSHYAFTNEQGETVVQNLDEVGTVSVFYPTLTQINSAPEGQFTTVRQGQEKFLRQKAPFQFTSLSDLVPVRDCLWIKDLKLGEDKVTRATVDLSECTSTLQLRFLDTAQKPLILKHIDLIRIPEGTDAAKVLENPKDRFLLPFLQLQTDHEGRITFGKVNPGQFCFKWSSDLGTESGEQVIQLEQNKTLTQDITLKPAPAKTTEPKRAEVPDFDSDRFPPQPPQKPLKITLLGPDKKSLPDALLAINYQSPQKRLRTEFAVSNQQGQLEVKFPEKGQVSISYPLRSEIPASEYYHDEARHMTLAFTMKQRLGDNFKNLEQHVPVKNVIWISNLDFQANGEDRATVDLSRCNSDVQLEFVTEQGQPVIPQQIELSRFPDNPNAAPELPSNSSRYSFRIKTDDQGRLSLGKMNPGKYEVAWIVRSQQIYGRTTLLVEEDKPLKHRIITKPVPQETPRFTAPSPPPSAPPSTSEPRYEGKTFHDWRDELKHEIAADTLAKGINILSIFALRGHREESIRLIAELLQSIPSEMKDWGQSYDTVFENAGKSLHKAGNNADPVLLPWLKSENPTRRVIALQVLRSQFSDNKELPEKILADLRPLQNDPALFIRGLALPLLMKQPPPARTAYCRDCFADKNVSIRQQAFFKLTGSPQDFDSPVELLAFYYEQYPWEKPTHDSTSDLNFRNEFPQRLMTFVKDVTDRKNPALNAPFNLKPGWFQPLYPLLLSDYFSSEPKSELESNTQSLLMLLFDRYPQVLELDTEDPLEKFKSLAQSRNLSPEKKSSSDGLYKLLKQSLEKQK